METAVEHLSEYELERGKPMPNAVHGAIQANLSFELKLRYRMVFERPGYYRFFHHDDTLTDPNTGLELPLNAIFA